MSSKTKQCYECKNVFRVEELVSYAGPRAKQAHSYCPKCLKEKQSRDLFSEKVCYIFGLKAPGPRIWTERKRIIEKYGYTDDTIVECLDYIYKVKKFKKLAESLYLVTPPMVDEMKRYKRMEQGKSIQLTQAMNMETNEYVVPIKENIGQHKIINNPDAWLED